MSLCRRYLPMALVLVTSTVAVHADDAKPEPVPPYELKNKSSFEPPSSVIRAPFWPIGWVKRTAASPEAPVVAQVKVTLDEKAFKVTSILLGSGATPSLAVINGRAYTEGEFLRMPKTPGAAPIRIRVQRINDGTVILQHADQILVAALRREELPSKRPDEQLLDADR